MNLKKLLAPVAAAVLAIVPAVSQAALIIQITDGTTTLNIADGGALDGIAEAGGVAYSGRFGSGCPANPAAPAGPDCWSVTAGFGASASDPLSMHLSAIVMGDRNDGRVWIRFTHTGLGAATDPMTFLAEGGGAGAYGSQASWAAYVDDSDRAFGTGQMIIGTNSYTTAGASQSVGLSGTYSATLVTSFDYTNLGNGYMHGSSLDLNLRVPEPTSLALLGLGLVGIGVVRRRKG